VNHPHVITHLFMDGGRILKSVKKSYAEHVGGDGMQDKVRVLMKEQHKAMFIALRDGQFDELVDGPKKGSDPTQKSVVAPPKEAAAVTATTAAVTTEAAPQSGPATNPEPPRSVEEPAPNTIAERAAPPPALAQGSMSLNRVITPEPFALDVNGPQTIPEPVVPAANGRASIQRPSAAELTLDFDALERDSGSGVNPIFQSNDLPPPPKNLFAKERGTGAYSTLDVETHHDDTRKHDEPPRKVSRTSVAPPRMPTKPPPSARNGTGENGRYAAARPATIFGSNTLKPTSNSTSIFGDDLVSDKSLDEVILSYLAEDLDPRK
jgi:hypothetical protein